MTVSKYKFKETFTYQPKESSVIRSPVVFQFLTGATISPPTGYIQCLKGDLVLGFQLFHCNCLAECLYHKNLQCERVTLMSCEKYKTNRSLRNTAE